MSTFVTVIHVVTCVLLVLVVLMQAGKGAEISSTLGGSSQTVFGSSGGANFFTRFTFTLAGIFAVTSMVLTLMGSQSRKSVFEGMAPAPVTSPVGNAEGIPASAPPAATAPAQNAVPTSDAAKK